MLQERENVQFGLFTANLHAGELKKGQNTVPLQNLPFRVLAVLLRDPGRVYSREELRQELWPADTFVDFERGISTAVNKLREALGDSATNPRFIETVGRRGYRFIAPVTAVGPETAALRIANPTAQAADEPAVVPAEMQVQVAPAPSPGIGLRKRTVFLGLAIVAIALVALAFDRMAGPPAPRILKITQLTSSGKTEPAGGLHTDGTRIYFTERSGSTWTLMQTSIAGGEVVSAQVPFPQTILSAFSPDRTEMLLTTRVHFLEKHAIWIAPIQGGTPRRVGDLMVDGCAWFPDGLRLLCVDGHEVFSVERDGTERRHLLEAPGGPWAFSWRPDGKSFRFSVSSPDDDVHLWEASADGSNPHRLLTNWNESQKECCGAWSPDGRNYVFDSQQGNLWLLHESSGWPWHGKPKLIALTNGPTAFSDPVFSPDGKKLFATGILAQAYVAAFNQQTRQFSRATLPNDAFDLAFSHDGKWISYAAGSGLWRSRIDGSDKLLLTAPPVHAIRPRWSPDGRQILFIGRLRGDRYSAYIVSADGGALHAVIENDPFYRDYADWSPDQKSVIVGVSLSGSTPEHGITLVDLETHRASVIPGSEGMIAPRWSPHGDYIAAASTDFKKAFLFDMRSQEWKQVVVAAQIWKFEWERDGSHVFYQDVRDAFQPLFRLDPVTGKTERIADCSKFLSEGALRCTLEGVAPDGALVVSVLASWANVYAFDIELP
jgi:Tol biopolymer transport system component/DNA-binding winged helix-turn-helix (wHTH) protein